MGYATQHVAKNGTNAMAPVEMEKVKKFRNMLEACFHANKMKYHTRVVEIPPPPLGWLGLRAASTEIMRHYYFLIIHIKLSSRAQQVPAK